MMASMITNTPQNQVIRRLNRVLKTVAAIDENNFEEILEKALRKRLGPCYQLYLFAITYVHTVPNMQWTVPLLNFITMFEEERGKIRLHDSNRLKLMPYGIKTTSFTIPHQPETIEYMADVLQNVEYLTSFYPGHESFYNPRKYRNMYTLHRANAFTGMNGEPRAVLTIFRILLAVELFERLKPQDDDKALKDILKTWWWNAGEFNENYPLYLGDYTISTGPHYPGVFGKMLHRLGIRQTIDNARDCEDPRLISPYLACQRLPWVGITEEKNPLSSDYLPPDKRNTAVAFQKRFTFPAEFKMPHSFDPNLISPPRADSTSPPPSNTGDTETNTDLQADTDTKDHSVLDVGMGASNLSSGIHPEPARLSAIIDSASTTGGETLRTPPRRMNTFNVPYVDSIDDESPYSNASTSGEPSAPHPSPSSAAAERHANNTRGSIDALPNQISSAPAQHDALAFGEEAVNAIEVPRETSRRVEESPDVHAPGVVQYPQHPPNVINTREPAPPVILSGGFGIALSTIIEVSPAPSPAGASRVSGAPIGRRVPPNTRTADVVSVPAEASRPTEQTRASNPPGNHGEASREAEEASAPKPTNVPEEPSDAASQSSSSLSAVPSDLHTPTPSPSPGPPPPPNPPLPSSPPPRRSGRRRQAPERYNPITTRNRRRATDETTPTDKAKSKATREPQKTPIKRNRRPARGRANNRSSAHRAPAAPQPEPQPRQAVTVTRSGRVRRAPQRYIP